MCRSAESLSLFSTFAVRLYSELAMSSSVEHGMGSVADESVLTR